MAHEIERKFLVRDTSWLPRQGGSLIRQGYILSGEDRVVRVRIRGDRAYLCVKASIGAITRLEYEYPIPLDDAHEMLDRLCELPPIEKTRHEVTLGDALWEIDVFHGSNDGLVVAELELEDENQEIDLPEWIGEEVSTDPRYLNASLARKPYSEW